LNQTLPAARAAATTGHDLTSSHVLIKYDPVTTGGYSGSHLKEDASDTNIASITYDHSSGMLNADISGANWSGSNSSNSVALPASSLWIRYRHAAGTLYLEYSVGGSSWTVLHSAATTGAMDTALTDSKLLIECGPFGSAITSGPSFAKLNLPPTSTDATAGQASSTATAQQPAAHVAPNAGSASATATAQPPAASIAPTAGQASATAVAATASVSITSSAGQATATATGQQAAAGVAPNAGQASSTAAGQQAAVRVAPTAGQSSATAAAHDAGVSTTASPTAGEAAATATAHNAAASTSSNPTAGINHFLSLFDFLL
jgi:hypothetical protein